MAEPKKGFKRVAVHVTVKYVACVEVPENVVLSEDSEFLDEITNEVHADHYQWETNVDHQVIVGGDEPTQLRFEWEDGEVVQTL